MLLSRSFSTRFFLYLAAPIHRFILYHPHPHLSPTYLFVPSEFPVTFFFLFFFYHKLKSCKNVNTRMRRADVRHTGYPVEITSSLSGTCLSYFVRSSSLRSVDVGELVISSSVSVSLCSVNAITKGRKNSIICVPVVISFRKGIVCEL